MAEERGGAGQRGSSGWGRVAERGVAVDWIWQGIRTGRGGALTGLREESRWRLGGQLWRYFTAYGRANVEARVASNLARSFPTVMCLP